MGNMQLNEKWKVYIKSNGADFVKFIDISALPEELKCGYTCAVLFGRYLPKEYLKAMINGEKTERNELVESERIMNTLCEKLAEELTAEGYDSAHEFKSELPHKTIARLAGTGFIGKNTMLIEEKYGCAVIYGKVMTKAPFSLTYSEPVEQKCGDCRVCVDICPDKALSGTPWSPETPVKKMLSRKLCTICMKCLLHCPYTVRYAESAEL